MICEAFGVARSSFYLSSNPVASEDPRPKKRGPETKHTDEEIVAAIRDELDDPDFSGEGHKKIHARLRSSILACSTMPGALVRPTRTPRSSPATTQAISVSVIAVDELTL